MKDDLMMNRKKGLGSSSGDQQTSINMSKLARAVQSAAAKTNWNEMVKVLFRADPHQGRPSAMRTLTSSGKHSPGVAGSIASYSLDQFQYILTLMLIISVAEKRTQEMYGQGFADRCDDISKDHQLQDDQYWTIGNVPGEWSDLTTEFEQRSQKILLETLREYHQDEIADLVESNGPDQLFSIIRSVKSQFLKVLENSAPAAETAIESKEGSIPETLQPSVRPRKS